MNADLRCFSVVALLLALMGADSAAKPPEQSVKEAIAAIEKLGGEVRFTSSKENWVGYWVDLSNTKVTDTEMMKLKSMTNLNGLYLNNTKISDAGLMHLKGLTKVRLLDFTNTNVGDGGLEHLKGLTNLEFLFLSDLQIRKRERRHITGVLSIR